MSASLERSTRRCVEGVGVREAPAAGAALLQRLHDDFGNRRIAAVLREADPEGHDKHLSQLVHLAVADMAGAGPGSNREMMEALRSRKTPMPPWLRGEVAKRLGPESDVPQAAQEWGPPDVVEAA